MFLSTRSPYHLYKFLVLSCKKNAENYLQKKLNLNFFSISKYPSIQYLFFIAYLILSGVFFNKKKRPYIKYCDIEIGRFVIAETMKSLESYLSKYHFYIALLRNFYRAGLLLQSCKKYVAKKNIDAAYIDHCMYLNGIIYSYFAKNKIPIYTNNYPLSIYMIDFSKSYNKSLISYENSVKISLKKKLKKNEIIKTKKILKKITCTKNYLPWMYIKYKKYTKINYKKFDYIVYAHSFLDAQLLYGNDDFENTYDWLDFTLNKLQKDNKRVLIKAHPNFYERSLGLLYFWDNKIFNNIKKKYNKNKNFHFLDKPLFNYDLLKKVSKKCILITQHGTVILEGSFLGFKTIGSQATFYDKKFNHTTLWSNKSEYSKLLESNYKNLRKPN